MKMLALVFALTCSQAWAQGVAIPPPVVAYSAGPGLTISGGVISNAQPYSASQAASDLGATFATPSAMSAAIASATAVVNSNIPTTAQIVTAAQNGITSFANPNITMPNGANLAHTIFVSTATQTLSSTSDTSCFSTSGIGSQTLPAAAFFPGARFRFLCRGIVSTGAVNTAYVTAKIKFGSTTVVNASTAAFPINLVAAAFWFEETCTVRVAGVSGSVICDGGLSYTTGISSVTALLTPLISPAPVPVDTSLGLRVDATSAWSNNTGTPTATATSGSIEQVN